MILNFCVRSCIIIIGIILLCSNVVYAQGMQNNIEEIGMQSQKENAKDSRKISNPTHKILLNKAFDPYHGISRKDITSEFYEAYFDDNNGYIKNKKLPSEDIVDFDILFPVRDTIGNELISLNLTSEVSIKDILLEIARMSNLDIEIDPSVDSKVIVSINNRRLDEALHIIARLGNVRYEFTHGIIRVVQDLPRVVNYYVDFINVVRSTQSVVNIDTKVVTADSRSHDTPTGSVSNIRAKYDGDLWAALEHSLQSIIQNSSVLHNEYYSINRQAGIITVYATDKTHINVKKYIEDVKKLSSSQVLIEAKIVEILLNDEYKSGVDWNVVNSSDNRKLSLKFDSNNEGISDNAQFNLTGTLGGGYSLNAAVHLLNDFGVVRTVSSPRLHAINNQQAVLSFAKNHVYFTVDVSDTVEDLGAGDTRQTFGVNSKIHSVPVGVILTLQPSINLETNEISMSIHPTLSRITDTVRDPGTEFVARRNNITTLTSNIPVIEVRELDSMVKVKNGDIMVIGGLMENRQDNKETMLPLLGDIPIIGNLFKSRTHVNSIVETVMFIKATIIPSSGIITDKDAGLYNDFVRSSQL